MYGILLILPIDKYSIYINNFDGKGFDDSAKYVCLAISEKYPNIKIYWLGNYKKCECKNVKFVKRGSLNSVVRQATSKIWISNVRMPAFSVKRKNQIYIQMWHGIFGIKKIENEIPDALTHRYIWKAKYDSRITDYYISANADNTKSFKKYFWRNNGKILEVGDPRDDIIINATDKEVSALKQKYGYENIKLCLYAPTFRKDGGIRAYNINYNELIKSLNHKYGGKWKIIIRLHPNIADKAKSQIQYDDNIINGSDFKCMEELLLISDVVITDYSSICFDFLYTGKPIFIYASDIDEYSKDRDFHIQLTDLPFSIATNNDELDKSISKFDICDFHNKCNEFMDRFGFIKTGDATEKVCDLIENVIENNDLQVKD